MRKLVYFVGASIDGLIAASDGSIAAFFPLPDGLVEHLVAEYPQTLPTHLHEAVGVTVPSGRFDTVIQGRGTYEPALAEGISSPYAHLEQYVVSTSLGDTGDPRVHVVADPVATVRELKAREGGDIWLAGGSKLAGSLFGEIDELIVKLYPLVLGTGKPMFEGDVDATRFALVESTAIGTGGALLQRYTVTR
ncbi:dihydrofolate reductase family protein [Phytomonospora endophytica]|uniref:Dihydrofolate reductase n=1 Tax=Phytomonospora endophytica TaxID=714109 RepID=A0A841FHC0_9ACTN|nr:dihydrofolate reductase family protein [Phytomonospora endophytica]MBB6035125.1 dihydrofolate reductase [Phytomonospora endophytica]GIG64127.1 deaminase [Phytomonospora endophytica]